MCRIDRERVECFLKEIREGLEVIKEITNMDINSFICSRSVRFAIRYSIILIVESAADLGITILKQCFNESVRSYREVFLKLAEKGVISLEVAEGMASLASLRNMIVHRYWDVDDVRIYREARGRGTDIIERFIKEIEDHVSKDP